MTKAIFWLVVIIVSGFMSFMTFAYGDGRALMNIFRVVFPVLTIWGLKKYNDVEAEYGPRPRAFALGQVQVYNDILEAYTTTEQKIIVECVEPFRKIFDFKTYPSKYEHHMIVSGDNRYPLSALTKFILREDDSIAKHYADSAALKRANGRGGQSIADAAARRRDLHAARRLEVEFQDGESFLLANVDERIVKDIQGLITHG